MKPDTPPQPAHGEPWPTLYLDESIGCFGDVRRQDTDEQYIHIQPVGPGGSKERNDQRQAIGRRVADTWNLLALHPDLSIIEVHSKETMDEVRSTLEKVISREYRFIMDADEPASKEQKDFLGVVESALAKLNPVPVPTR